MAAGLAKDFTIMLCGGSNEASIGREIAANAGVPVINATGQTSLLEMAALLERAAVVVAGDTGPLYMAAALKVPTVAIFGPTNPATYAPPGKQNLAIFNQHSCSFCHKRSCSAGHSACMSSVLPEQAVQGVYRVLKSQPEDSF
jgi:ADP-heptose:LPS heptosyltransferase